MELDRDNIFRLGKCFDTGLVSFDALSDSQKWALKRYYAMKGEELDAGINTVASSLTDMNNQLDSLSNSIKNYKKL